MSKAELEVRRRTAVKLVVDGGMTRREAAAAVGAAPSSVTKWVQTYESEGEAGLAAKPEPKPRSGRLSQSQRTRLATMLRRGPRAHGYSTDLWTLSRIAELVEKKFGTRFHVGHMHRIVQSLGFTAQRPARRARQQDVKAVDRFRKETWPELGKGRGRKVARSS